MMRRGFARIAVNHSKQIGIQKQRPVQDHVAVQSVQIVGITDVYDLSVLRYHNFAICGGMIVHNCMDAVRYLVKTIINRGRLMAS